jgi:hypothetical protein
MLTKSTIAVSTIIVFGMLGFASQALASSKHTSRAHGAYSAQYNSESTNHPCWGGSCSPDWRADDGS